MPQRNTRPTPYAGITDFMTCDDAVSALRFFQKVFGNNSPRRLMVGVMMSYKTLTNIPCDWTNVFPKNDEIASIYQQPSSVRHLAYNTTHYADYKGRDEYKSIAEVIRLGGPDLDAVQFDMTWPDQDTIRLLRHDNPKVEFILQVGVAAMEVVQHNPQMMLNRISGYGNAIDHVLLDLSMGRGKGIDVDLLRPFVKVLYECDLNIGVVVAGGLGPKTVEVIRPLVNQFPGISCDAQSKLRPSGNIKDPLDQKMCFDYLEEAAQLFGSH